MLNFVQHMYQGGKPTGFMKHYFTLFSMVEGLEAKKTFEFGTGISTKAIMLAHKFTGGTHTSCDVRNITDTGLSLEFYEENKDIWTYLKQNSLSLNKKQLEEAGPFDFVLHDGSHIASEVYNDINKILPYMKKNSILLVHDTESENYDNSLKKAVLKATDILGKEGREYITLPYGYGLTIIRILYDFGNGTVTPTWKKM